MNNSVVWEVLDGIVANGSNYEVSSEGKVRNKSTGRELLGTKGNHGYYVVTLSDKGDYKPHLIHRLVLLAFVEKPFGKDIVNHIDGNKENNNLQNLEWVTRAENNQHAWTPGIFDRSKHRKSASVTGKIYGPINQRFTAEAARKPVIQYDLSGGIIQRFPSVAEASRKTGVKSATISRQCVKESGTKFEFYFRFAS